LRPLVRLAAASLAVVLSAGLVQSTALAADSVSTSADTVAPLVDPTDPPTDTPTDPPADSTDPTDPPVVERAPAPDNLAVEFGDGAALISFVQPESVEPILNYQYAFSIRGPWEDVDPAAPAGPITIGNLVDGAPYEVWIRPVTTSGPGYKSKRLAFRTPSAEPTKPSKPVRFEVAGEELSNGVKIKPGDALKIRDVPSGGSVVVIDKKDPDFNFEVRETDRAHLFTTGALPPARRLYVTVLDVEGNTVAKVNFFTLKAEKSFSVSVWPKGDNLGSGVPLVVTFGMRITDKAAVERQLTVTSDKDFGEAGWYWIDEGGTSKAVFRPRNYWPGNATIRLDANLASVEGAEGYWGPKVSTKFGTGDQVVLRVNLRKHTMKYTINGVTERNFLISGGMSGWETEAGTKILTAHIPDKRLYNPDPEEGWDVTVNWAIRVNDNGEYIHDAPWNYSIGYANTSHGCTNMTVSDMQWLFRNTKFGDVAEYNGSKVKMGTDDYLAGYWNYKWNEWKQGSALYKKR